MSKLGNEVDCSQESLLTLVSRGVCHEISNLLTAIYGHAGLARAQLETGHPARDALDQIENAARSAADAVRTLMLVGRTTRSAYAPARVEHLLETAGRIIRGVIPSSIGLRVLPMDDAMLVFGDLAMLRNALLEYAIRLRELIGAGGEMELTAARGDSPDQIVVELRGTRNGMQPVSRDLFETWSGFVLAPDTAAAQVLEGHGGSISAAISAGAAQIRISLPLHLPAGPIPEAVSDSATRSGNRGVVLIAEDYDLIRGLMASTLESRGFEVVQARDGPGLLSQHTAQRDRLTHLLIDVDLPGRNGLDCLREIRAAGSLTTTVLVTGATSSEIEDLSDSNTFVFRKPFQMAELADFVSRLNASGPR